MELRESHSVDGRQRDNSAGCRRFNGTDAFKASCNEVPTEYCRHILRIRQHHTSWHISWKFLLFPSVDTALTLWYFLSIAVFRSLNFPFCSYETNILTFHFYSYGFHSLTFPLYSYGSQRLALPFVATAQTIWLFLFIATALTVWRFPFVATSLTVWSFPAITTGLTVWHSVL